MKNAQRKTWAGLKSTTDNIGCRLCVSVTINGQKIMKMFQNLVILLKRELSFPGVAEEANISKIEYHGILTENLGIRRIAATLL